MDATAVELPGDGYFIRLEEVPTGTVNHLIRSVAEDINNRIRRVENASLVREVYKIMSEKYNGENCVTLPWIVMKVVSMI